MATTKVDVVGIFDPVTLAQLFPLAQPMAADIKEGGRVMSHPLEDGSQTTDHIVYELTEITLPMMVQGDIKARIDEFRQTFKAGKLLNVQTRAGVYPSMVIAEFPHAETSDAIDAATVTLKLSEARFITPTQGGVVPRHPKHAKATGRGQVQAQNPPATTPQGSWLFRHVPVN